MEIIAHRGVHSKKEEENTLRAFSRAVATGCTMLELDVRRTKDNQLIVAHDPSFFFRGHEIFINHHNLDYLLDSGLVMNRVLLADDAKFKIPTIQLVLKFFLHRIKINIELKDPYSSLLLGETMDHLIKNSRLQQENLKQIIVSSFLPDELLLFRKAYPDIPLALLLGVYSSAIFLPRKWVKWLKQNNIEAVHLSHRTATQRTIVFFKDRGFKVRVYVVNDLEALPFYQACEVDGIFTDRPGEFMKVLGQKA